MNAYNVVVSIQDHRNPDKAPESKQVNVNAGNAPAAARNAICMIGYGILKSRVSRTGPGEYTAKYHDLATFRLYPYKLTEGAQ